MPNPEALPLTPAQEGILFESLAGQGAYVQQLACTVSGTLEIDAFAAAWQQALARHPALRTTFARRDSGEPIQLLHADAQVPITVLDWRDHDENAQAQMWAQLLADDRRAGFRLSVAPLLRLHVVRVGDERHRLLWSVHHILVDGWSAALVLADVFDIHAALRDGRSAGLPAAGSFVAYLEWLRQQDETAAREAWSANAEALRDAAPLPRDADGSADGLAPRELTRLVPAAEVERLEVAARAWGVPLNAVLQATWAIVLARFTSSPSAAFGLTITHRPAAIPLISSTAGVFINTLPAVAQVEGRTLAEIARDLHRATAELQEHAHVSPALIRRWCEIAPEQPVFDTILSFEDYLGHDRWWRRDPRIAIDEIAILGQTNAICTALVARVGQELRLRMLVDVAQLHVVTGEALIDDWRDVVGAACAAPQATVAELASAAAERGRQFQAARNRTERPLPDPATIPAVLGRIVAAHPDAVAIADGDVALTYAQLEQRSRAVAGQLAQHGVGPGTPVPLLTSASAQALVTIVAITRIGAFFVPLDADAPAARSAAIVEQLGARVAVVGDGCTLACEGVVSIELGALVGDDAAAAPPLPDVAPGDAAYAIFTSGSTGRPKGVVVPHRAVVRLACAQEYVSVTAGMRVAQLSTLAFDAATFEIFGALLNGATVVILGTRTLLDPIGLGRALAADAIDVAFLTTAVFNTVADACPNALGTCTSLLFGGESADPDRVRSAREASSVQLVHVYGPTETTTFATAQQVDEVPPDARTVPIGTPIANTTTWVLDGQLNPLPVGAVGELCVGGAGVGAYLDDDASPAFVADPFSQDAGARLYRTGDLARWTGVGVLEFVGRRDDQVKVRGFRIELGEIEAALLALPAIAEARVLATGDGAQRRLVAFVVARGGKEITAAAVAPALRERLPRYMVPSAIWTLEAWPLTASGKVDRRRLLELAERGSRANGGTAAAPHVRGQSSLAAVRACFDRVLEHAIGPDDHFFEAGGHSLLAVRLVGELRGACDVPVEVVDVFAHPTPRALAAELASRTAGVGSS